MPNANQEQERLRRLRERQLTDRDPLVKQRQYQHLSAQRIGRDRNPITVGGVLKVIPAIWKGAAAGLFAGLLALLIVPLFWNSPYTLLCVGGGTLIAVLFGMVTGASIDWRDEINQLIK